LKQKKNKNEKWNKLKKKSTITKAIPKSVQQKFWSYFFGIKVQLLALMTGSFSLSLCLLKVGILGCVERDASPLWQQLGRNLAGVILVLFSFV
jgi:hypothetical protein